MATDISHVSLTFKRIAEAAAVKGNNRAGYCTLHDLRRNFGSRWTLKVPAQVLQRLMRHATIGVTLDFYADAERAAMNAIWGEQAADVTDRVTPARKRTRKPSPGKP